MLLKSLPSLYIRKHNVVNCDFRPLISSYGTENDNDNNNENDNDNDNENDNECDNSKTNKN